MLVMMLIPFVCSDLSYFISHSANIKFCVLQSLRAQMFLSGIENFTAHKRSLPSIKEASKETVTTFIEGHIGIMALRIRGEEPPLV